MREKEGKIRGRRRVIQDGWRSLCALASGKQILRAEKLAKWSDTRHLPRAVSEPTGIQDEDTMLTLILSPEQEETWRSRWKWRLWTFYSCSVTDPCLENSTCGALGSAAPPLCPALTSLRGVISPENSWEHACSVWCEGIALQDQNHCDNCSQAKEVDSGFTRLWFEFLGLAGERVPCRWFRRL